MTKIAIVGAGSLVFTRALVSDLLQQEPTADAEIDLVDIDDRRLGEAVKAVEAMAITSGRGLPLVASTDCAEGVRGCNYVVNTIQVGGKRATAVDFDLPEKFGVRQTIADTHGIGGISRALRTLPAVLEICGTVAEHAPDAYLLNYTNPMAMVVMGIARSGFPRYVGLCHGTEHTAADIAGYLAVDQPERLTWQAAGINHMTWFLELDVRGEDVYPRLREFARQGGRRQAPGRDPSRTAPALRLFRERIERSQCRVLPMVPSPGRRGRGPRCAGSRVPLPVRRPRTAIRS